MSLFRQSPIKKFTPKTVNFGDLYKKQNKFHTLSKTEKLKIEKSLEKNGLSRNEIKKIVSDNKPIEAKKMKEVIGKLSQDKAINLVGNANKIVNDYIHGEAVKRKNVALVRKEYMLESRRDEAGQKPKIKNAKISRLNLPF